MSWLVFFILLVTIPRYSSAFSDVDTFVLFGIQIAALGEAIAMSLGEWMIMQTVGVCRRVQLRWRADWERLDEINKAQEKTTRKRPDIPELKGSVLTLFVFMAVLEAIGIVSQVPHFVAQIREVPITTILPGTWLWVYVATLIVAPGILQAALALGQQYRVVANEYVPEKSVQKRGKLVQAISEWVLGKFRVEHEVIQVEQPVIQVEQEPVQEEPIVVEPVIQLKPGQPDLKWWKETYSAMNGEREQVTPAIVARLISAEYEEMPSVGTLYNWVKECKESVQEVSNG